MTRRHEHSVTLLASQLDSSLQISNISVSELQGAFNTKHVFFTLLYTFFCKHFSL